MSTKNVPSTNGPSPLLKQWRRRFINLKKIGAALALGLLLQDWVAQSAPPPKDTPIGNQASATYQDASGTTRTATSNIAITIVQQVGALSLTSDNPRTAGPGAQVAYPHTLVNNGNGIDNFLFTLVQSGTDSFDLLNVKIYADANGDGVPDNSVDLTTTGTGPVAANGVFRFVIVGNVPGTAIAGNTGVITIQATSVFDGTKTSLVNTDTVAVTANAAINVTKSFSVGQGPTGTSVTVTLSYVNSGNNSATNLTLGDVIPTGMTYVGGSARWSVTGGTVLTDTDKTDLQGTAPNQIIYDFGVTAAGKVTAVVSRVSVGQSGTVSFQVTVNAGVAPGIIPNTATFSYDPGTGLPTTAANSNTAQFDVTQNAAVTFTGETVASANQGATVSFHNVVHNGGNGVDTFDITFATGSFPAGSAYALFQPDGVTPLTDSTGNGVPDTGPLAKGADYTVVIRVTLPTGTSGGGAYTLNKTATSKFDPTKTAVATDTLTTIAGNVVSLVNNDPVTGTGGTGAAVTTVFRNPGTTASFTLYVKNISGTADSYDLKSSAANTWGPATALPTGWVVTFKNAGGAVIASTDVLAPGANQLVTADVAVPAGYAPGTVDIYFRAISPTTGAHSEKRDAVTVNTVRGVSVGPNNSGQIFPGGTMVYSHVIANNGNVPEGDNTASTITLGVAESQSGWNSVIYLDADNNGTLDPTDPVITHLPNTGLAPVGQAGSSVRVFVKVFSPVGVLSGSDTTTLTVTTANGTYGTTIPPVVTANDNTTIISGDLVMEKYQTLDTNADGTPDVAGDAAYSKTPITTGAKPGVGVRYKITVNNRGTADATAVVVNDATPNYTVYNHGDNTDGKTGQAVYTLDGTTFTHVGVTTPVHGAAGTLTFTIGTLTPGQTATIYFGVTINQ